MTQIRPPDLTDNWVMLGFENGEYPSVSIFTDDQAHLWSPDGAGTPLQRKIMALRLRYIADLLEGKKDLDELPYLDVSERTGTMTIDATGLHRIYLERL